MVASRLHFVKVERIDGSGMATEMHDLQPGRPVDPWGE